MTDYLGIRVANIFGMSFKISLAVSARVLKKKKRLKMTSNIFTLRKKEIVFLTLLSLRQILLSLRQYGCGGLIFSVFCVLYTYICVYIYIYIYIHIYNSD